MENLYLLSLSATSVELQDAICARINKSKAILTCLMFAAGYRGSSNVDGHTIYHALWAVDQYLEEMDVLFRQLTEHA